LIRLPLGRYWKEDEEEEEEAAAVELLGSEANVIDLKFLYRYDPLTAFMQE
jgi:hypothetical protein